jgi:hypothetical protein
MADQFFLLGEPNLKWNMERAGKGPRGDIGREASRWAEAEILS